jgi:hypothetical protein
LLKRRMKHNESHGPARDAGQKGARRELRPIGKAHAT